LRKQPRGAGRSINSGRLQARRLRPPRVTRAAHHCARPSRTRLSRTTIAAAERDRPMHPRTAAAPASSAPRIAPSRPRIARLASPPTSPPARQPRPLRPPPSSALARRPPAPPSRAGRRRQGHPQPRQTHTLNLIPTGSCCQSNSHTAPPRPLWPPSHADHGHSHHEGAWSAWLGGHFSDRAGRRYGLETRNLVRSMERRPCGGERGDHLLGRLAR